MQDSYVSFDSARVQRAATGFEIGGERFLPQDVHPDDIHEYQAQAADNAADTQAELLAQYQRFIEKFIRPDDRDRWRQLTDRREDPLVFGDYSALAVWLLERHNDRPTLPSSPSGITPSRGATGSEAGSSRRQVVVAGSS